MVVLGTISNARCIQRAKIDVVGGFQTHSGTLAVVPDDNVDTDRIIPARFLSMISKSGYGALLFKDVRGPEFPLDQTAAVGASILVVGTNFGCGSSREHAVWAIQQAGFACVIAKKSVDSPGYSDIFRQNAANCGLLLIELDSDAHQLLVERGSGATVVVDLPAQTIRCDELLIPFEMNPVTKSALIEGLDLIGTTMRYEDRIKSYERNSKAFVPIRQENRQ